MSLRDTVASFLKESKIAYDEDVLMSKMTTFRIGGVAPLVIYPADITQVSRIVRFFSTQKIPYFVIGNGSNLLIREDLTDKFFIKLSNLNKIQYSGEIVTLGAGCLNSVVAMDVLDKGLSGYEFAHGIPGSVGGAVAMNAGAYGHSYDEILQKVISVDKMGLIRTYTVNPKDFGYRKSPFADQTAIVCSAEIKLRKSSKTDIRAVMDELMQKRRASQPLNLPSAGSVFKRPTGFFAGKLIEEVGLKGYQVGDAQVSEKHAGFIVNVGHATAQDVLDLISHIQKTVLEQKGIHMETEVKVI